MPSHGSLRSPSTKITSTPPFVVFSRYGSKFSLIDLFLSPASIRIAGITRFFQYESSLAQSSLRLKADSFTTSIQLINGGTLNDTETLSPLLPANLEEATRTLLERACKEKLRLATAESCTGGMLASLLTDVKGVAHAFERGFVTYSEDSKTQLLGVSEALIRRKGVVSRDVAVAMAEGALARSLADIALAVTGFADDGDEPGLVHFACARSGHDTMHREAHFGSIGRGAVRIETLKVAVAMMTEML
jgi:nicotinamide-nucleotide amidase